ncbi:hypothetical protein ACFWZJ_14770 [Streptomyces massasporeus]
MLRHDQRLGDMAGGNDVSATTIRRRRDRLITLLAAKAPRLDRAGDDEVRRRLSRFGRYRHAEEECRSAQASQANSD